MDPSYKPPNIFRQNTDDEDDEDDYVPSKKLDKGKQKAEGMYWAD